MAPGPAREVADGVYRLGDRLVNWWLVVDRDAATLVDAGLPAQYPQLAGLLGHLGLAVDAIEAVVVTHGHLDHVACIAPLAEDTDVDVYVPAADRELATTRPKADPNVLAHSLNRHGLRTTASYVRQGILRAKPVVSPRTLADGERVDAPGGLRFVEAPGHTPGGGVFVRDQGDVVFAGDVLVTLDPFSGRTGPRTLPAFDNVDHAGALDALDVVAGTGATTILPGHGEPWHGDPHVAARQARLASV